MTKEYEKSLRITKNRLGFAVYAQRPFKKNDIVWIMKGEKVKLSKFTFKNLESLFNMLQVGKNKYIKLDKMSVSFNHSCNPNMGFSDNTTLFAIKNIKKGEELTYDYSTTIDESFVCDCRSKNCRHAIIEFFALPRKLMLQYYKRDMLPDFIKKKYKKTILKRK